MPHGIPPACRRRVRRGRALLLPLVVSVTLAACSRGGDGASLAWQTVTDTIGDTIVVRTVGASDSAATLRLVEELRIGELDGADEYSFANVARILATPDGGAYVWDATMGLLRQYDGQGAFVRQIGGKGSGPGEYQDANGIAQLPDGRLALWDGRNGRVTLYDSTGARSADWRASSSMFGWNGLLADTAGVLYLLSMLDEFDMQQPDAPRRQGFVRHAADGRVLDSLAVPAQPEHQTLRAVRREGDRVVATAVFPLPFAPQPTWRLSPLGYFVTGDGSLYAITLHRTSAPPLRIERDVPVVAVDPDERDNLIEITTARVRRMDPNWRWDGPAVPSTKPFFQHLAVGSDGRIWVARSLPSVRIEPAPEPASRPNAPPPRRWREPLAYDLYEPDGRFIGYVPVPHRTVLLDLDAERVWGVQYDSLDVPYVTRFRLEHSTKPEDGTR